MMFQQRKYTTTFQRKTRIFAVIAVILVTAALIALDGAVLAKEAPENWDVSYPMANAHVSWEQTFFGGGK